jgi:acyl carrier protein
MTTELQSVPPEVIQEWLAARLAQVLDLQLQEIDPHTPFDRYGLDSMAAVTLIGDLEEWLGLELPATLAWDYPNIAELSQYLAETVAESRADGQTNQPV